MAQLRKQVESREQDAFSAFLSKRAPKEKLPVILRHVNEDEHGGGLGLFATEDIPAGKLVCFYAGSFVPHRVIESQQNTHAILGGWTSDMGQVIDGRVFRASIPDVPHWAAGSIINSTLDANDKECCLPNVEVRVNPCELFHVNIVKTIMNQPFGYAMAPVISTDHIKKGEQLLYYYVFHKDFNERDMRVAVVNQPPQSTKEKKRIRLT